MLVGSPGAVGRPERPPEPPVKSSPGSLWVGLGPATRRAREALPPGGVGGAFVTGIRCVAMGDLNANVFAQDFHTAALREGSALPPDVTLEYGEPVPRGPVWEGVYTDDHACVAVADARGRVRAHGAGAERGTRALGSARISALPKINMAISCS